MKLPARLCTKTSLSLYLETPLLLCKWYMKYSCNMLGVEDVILDCLELCSKLS